MKKPLIALFLCGLATTCYSNSSYSNNSKMDQSIAELVSYFPQISYTKTYDISQIGDIMINYHLTIAELQKKREENEQRHNLAMLEIDQKSKDQLIADFQERFSKDSEFLRKVEALRNYKHLQSNDSSQVLHTVNRQPLDETISALLFQFDGSNLQKQMNVIRNFTGSQSNDSVNVLQITDKRSLDKTTSQLLFNFEDSDFKKRMDAIRNFKSN